jgi:acetyl-CoA carboxylase biotin carboxyl carrier protein
MTPEMLEEICRRIAEFSATQHGRLRCFTITAGELTVAVEWASAAPPAPTPPASPPAALAGASYELPPEPASEARDLLIVPAPIVGTFYHAPEPGAAPFVAVGDTIGIGQQVGIIEAMKLMTPVESPVMGRVCEIVVPNATFVEFEQPLIAVTSMEG